MFKSKKILCAVFIALMVLILIPVSFAHESGANITSIGDDAVVESIVKENVLGADNDYYFDASAESDGNGSQTNPYKYLKYSRIKDNSNIFLADGEYDLDRSKTINGINFIGNDSNKTIIKFSGVAFTVSGNVTLNNLTLKNSSIIVKSVLNATNVVFDGGSGSQHDPYGNHFGGAINCTKGSSTTLNINVCTFKNNHAEYGGAIYISSGSLNIVNSLFINNYAYNFGGAIASESGTSINISKSRFVNSKSLADAGGAIYVRAGNLNIDNVSIINSSATFGGAITTLNTIVSLNCLTAHNNTAKYDGGAVYHMYGNFTSQNGDYKNNSAFNGGALFIDGSSNFVLNSNHFTENKANFTAGAVYSFANNLTLNPSNIFRKNTAVLANDEYVQEKINLTIGNGNYTMYRNTEPDVTDLPSKYSLRDYNLLTIPKDQQTSGNCWAFAPIAVLESNIIKAGGGFPDLSEENMKNVIAKFSDYGWDMDTNNGGFDNMHWGYLSSWLGPVNETSDPFDDKGTLSPILNSIMHVQNILFLKRDNYTDNDAIKKAIMKYGAVGTSMGYYSNFTIYKNEYLSFYCGENVDSNHAVTIVGWDDNFSSRNFKTTPPGDGAWIVRNSWGPDWHPSFHNEGYFYVSYYDTRLAQVGKDASAYTFILNDTVRYDKNYQYDIAGMTDYYYTYNTTAWYKNIFRASDDEYLAGISTYFDAVTNWTASVIVNDVFITNISGTSNPGYYTFDLGNYIELNKGDVFEVVFKIESDDHTGVPISEKVSLNKLTYEPGISYVSYDGVNWTDFYYVEGSPFPDHNYYSQVACIKAFTFLNKIKTTLNLSVSYDEFITNISATVTDEFGNLLNHGNVTFNINGEEFTVNLSNGIAKINHTFSEAINAISAVFGAVGYNSYSNSTTLRIAKEKINFTDEISIYQNMVNLTVTASQPINVTIEVRINNKTYFGELKSGKYVFELELPNDDYEYNITIINNQIYEGNTSNHFTLSVLNTTVHANDLTVTDDAVFFQVTLTDELNSPLSSKLVYFKVDNQTYTNFTDDNGVAVLSLDLAAGTYPAIIQFAGDEKHFDCQNSSFIIVKNTVNLDLEIYSKNNRAVINVSLSKPLDVNVSFAVNGKNYYNMSDAGKAVLYLFDLFSNDYSVEVSLVNRENYVFESKTGNFTIDFNSTLVIPQIDTHYVGDSFDITVLSNLTAGVTVNGLEYNINNSKVLINTSELSAGEYIVTAYIIEDSVVINSTSAKFSIIKKDVAAPHISVPTGRVIVGHNATITVSMAKNETGNVIFEINNVNYTASIRNNAAVLNVSLPAGQYDVKIFYLGDKKYNPYNTTADKFNVVDKNQTNIFISISGDFNVGKEIAVSAVADNGEKVTVTVNGETLNDDGKYTIKSEGSYTVKATTIETDNCYAGFNSTLFVAFKNRPFIDIAVFSKDYSVGSEFTVNVLTDSDSEYTVFVNGKVNSGNKFTPESAGIYTVTVTTAETERYYWSSNSATVEVLKRSCRLIAESIEIYETQSKLMDISLSEGATGLICIEIYDNKFYGEIIGNKAVVNISGLKKGNYNANITYSGDDKFERASSTFMVNVLEAPEPAIELSFTDSKARIELPDDASGNIIVKFDGKTVYEGSVDNLEDFPLDDLGAGEHIIDVIYSGDGKYLSNEESMTLMIHKAESSLMADSAEINENETLILTVFTNVDATGIILVDIGDNRYYGEISSGRAALSISGLKSGQYRAKITYPGDEKYTNQTMTVTVKVNSVQPVTPNISINGLKNIRVGENETISVILPEDASGRVTLFVDGKKFREADLVNGIANVLLTGLSSGNHTVMAIYSGDEKYSSANVIGELSVSKRAPNINVYFKGNIINVDVSGDESGLILIDIEGIKFYGEISNGKSVINLAGLDGGQYAAQINYTGDNKYKGISTSALIKIKGNGSASPNMNVTLPANVIVGDDVDCKISLPSDARGNITVKVDGKQFINVKVGDNVKLTDLSAGNHTVEVIYSGDARYASIIKIKNLTVLKMASSITSGSIEIDEGGTAVINIGVSNDAEGIILLDVGGNKFYGEIANGKAGVNVFGLSAGKYTADIIYPGDDKYESASSSLLITVNPKYEPVTPAVTVNVPSNAKPDETPVVTINLPKDANGNAVVNVDGVEIASVPIMEGSASIPLEKLTSGAHAVEVSYSGDDKYAPVSKLSAISVNGETPLKVKKDTFIQVDSAFTRVATDYFADERGGFFYAILKDIDGKVLAGKTVQIAVNGPIYNVTTDNEGKAGLQVNLMGANIYTYALAFAGDDDYNAAKMASSKLTITKKPISISASNKAFKVNAKKTIKVTLKTSKNPYDGKTYLKSGKKVTLKVGGKTYTAKTNKGGIVKFTLKLTKKGKYSAKITFDGDNTYDASKKSIKITVK